MEIPGLALLKMKEKLEQNPSKKKNQLSFKPYIPIIQKIVHPELSISNKSVAVLASFVEDMIDKVAKESAALLRSSKRKRLTVRELETAFVLIIQEKRLYAPVLKEGSMAVASSEEA